MTLVVCMRTSEGIILAADSRGTIGDPRGLTAINDKQIKIRSIGVRCGIGITGQSEMGLTLLDNFGLLTTKSTDIDEVIKVVSKKSAILFDDWFKGMELGNRPPVLLTIAGYRHDNGLSRPMIYLLSSHMNFVPQLFDGPTPCLSGVPNYAVYLVHRYYEPNITLDRGKALAHYLIAETASQDPKVGGPIHIATITPSEGYQELTIEEIKEIELSNAELSQRLKSFFLKGETQDDKGNQ